VPEPLANWNPTRGVWETSELCLYGRSEPYSDPWPTSGTTRAGKAYARPTWALLTNDSECSSSPGLLGTPRTSSANGVGQYEENERGDRGRLEAQVDALLKTPGANLATNGGSQHPDKRKEGGHGPTLADEVEWLLPTPMTMNGKSGRTMETSTGGGQRNRGGHSGPPGLDEVVSLATGTRPAHLPPDEKLPPRTRQIVEAMLPTPTVGNATGGNLSRSGDRSGELLLPGIARTAADGSLLPTPESTNAKGGRRLRENGDPYGERTNPTLVDAVMLLPTPVTSDVKAVRNATAVRADPASAHSGTTLTDLFVPRSDGTPVLLPTPTTSQGGPEATRVRPDGSKGQTNLAGALLPTPLARDHRTGYQQERTDRVGSPPLNDAVVTIARPPVKPSGDRTEEPSDDGKLF
jgi:hypothetical protein